MLSCQLHQKDRLAKNSDDKLTNYRERCRASICLLSALAPPARYRIRQDSTPEEHLSIPTTDTLVHAIISAIATSIVFGPE